MGEEGTFAAAELDALEGSVGTEKLEQSGGRIDGWELKAVAVNGEDEGRGGHFGEEAPCLKCRGGGGATRLRHMAPNKNLFVLGFKIRLERIDANYYSFGCCFRFEFQRGHKCQLLLR